MPAKSFSFMWTAQLGREIARRAPKRGYVMRLVGEDRRIIMDAVNQGIDSHLEVCFVSDRGDSYEMRTPAGVKGRVSGPCLECRVSAASLPVLVRRLMERGTEQADLLASDICGTLNIELI